ncbi:MAG TPA: IS5 family transposase [Anaerolineae bacterium]|nr:IS5 family transposase [Anaerolineae bacterium]
MKAERKRWGHYKDKRDWKEYNERLVKRGEMYLNFDFLESWAEDVDSLNNGKVGSPFEYPESLMTFLGFMHVMLGVDYRGLEGFVRGLRKFVGEIKVPDYSTICRRVNALRLEITETLLGHQGEEVVISLDGSGIKVSNRGEWMRKQWKVRRGWIKVHLAVDKGKKQCVAIEVTDESVGGQEKFKPLVEEADRNIRAKGGRVAQANADGIYDMRDNFNTLDETGITPAIRIRKNASSRARGCPLRKKHVREYRELGYKPWRKKYGYGFRWRVEGNFSAVKRLAGEYVVATKRANVFKEVVMKFLFYNSILKHDAEGELPWRIGAG